MDPSSTFAEILASIVRQFLTDVPTCLKRATKHIEPLIKERLQKEVDFGSSDWPDKPVSLFVDGLLVALLTSIALSERPDLLAFR